jgi:peptidoglycan hydrolase-like protein with peptidoglycan-binding domain
MLVGHKEWAPKRKIDPAGIDMDLLRKVVRGAIHGNPRPTVVQEGFDVSKLAMVKRGSRGDNVARVQGLLLAAEVLNVSENVRSDKLDGIFGPSTERSVRSFQSKSGLVPDGIVGERTWSALLGV